MEVKAKVHYTDYLKFRDEYFVEAKYPHERYGQAFLNKFDVGPCPELYYQKENKMAMEMIQNDFVNWGNAN